MMSDDERDDLIADRNFILGREYEREAILKMFETTSFVGGISGDNGTIALLRVMAHIKKGLHNA